ncbi:MAG: tRNA epoxyqueuosine(34) reductase QueG [Paludibacter sp.]
MQKNELSSFVKQAAFEVGFDACGIAKAEELTEDAAYLKQWLSEGKHGDMYFLTQNFEKRTDPRQLVPGCKSVVVVLLNYFPKKPQNPLAPQIAKYAYSAVDYHFFIKEKLKQLEQKITERFGSEIVASDFQHAFVDSAPVLERRWAQRAGLGWIGKNMQLIHPHLGSFIFIGVLMLNSEAEYDVPIDSHCGNCTRCIDSCPTNALNINGLNATKCLSYLTIESKYGIDSQFHAQLSNYALGCDICADVCPWNKKWAIPHKHTELSPINQSFVTESVLEWSAEDWHQLSKEKFNQIFKKSALKRAGYEKLKQNIEILKKTTRFEK